MDWLESLKNYIEKKLKKKGDEEEPEEEGAQVDDVMEAADMAADASSGAGTDTHEKGGTSAKGTDATPATAEAKYSAYQAALASGQIDDPMVVRVDDVDVQVVPVRGR